MGRLEPIKGIKEAIDVARASEEDLVIAGNIPQEYQDYFDQEVKPYLSEKVRYVGPVNDEQKRNLFQEAKALLFPIQWEEPFGIVMAESLACGVPVIAYKKGAVPEVIEHNINGFVCNNKADFIEAIKKLPTISAKKCRETAVEKFSAVSVAKKYIQLFYSI